MTAERKLAMRREIIKWMPEILCKDHNDSAEEESYLSDTDFSWDFEENKEDLP